MSDQCKSCEKSRPVNQRGECEECAVVVLTVDAIRDYHVCELYYELKYLDHLTWTIERREILVRKFENTLKKIASFFFYKKQAGSVPSYSALLNRWEKLWFPKDMDAYDIMTEQHEISHHNLVSFSNIAAAAIERFHSDFAESKAVPIMIDEKYIVPLGGVRLEGKFDLVLKNRDTYQVIKWSARQKRPGVNSLVLEFAALKHAFEHRNDQVRMANYQLYDLSSASSSYISIDQPHSDDVKALSYWASEIAESETFVPRRGFTSYCRGCIFDKECREWNEWPVSS